MNADRRQHQRERGEEASSNMRNRCRPIDADNVSASGSTPKRASAGSIPFTAARTVPASAAGSPEVRTSSDCPPRDGACASGM